MATHNLRIKGLVAVAADVRRQWRAGIPVEEADAFRRRVSDTIALVDQLCRDHDCAPAHIPRPSYQAYAFLKSLDLEHLPLREGAVSPAPKVVRIKNVLAVCDRMQADLQRVVEQAPPPSYGAAVDSPEAMRVLQSIAAAADQVEAICRESLISPADLPVQSRRAYQWLRFLSDPANLAGHFAALGLLRQIIEEADWTRQPRLGGRAIRPELFHIGVTHRMRIEGQTVVLILAQGFCCAPREVLEALLQAILLPGQKQAFSRVKAYVAGEDFAEVTSALELLAVPSQDSQRGRHYDLAQVFDRVNAACFAGGMPRPKLAWSQALTARKMGHYQFASDTVVISLTLDDPRVPEYVIDLVMYHELLHKQMGARLVNGRRYAHTDAFRQAERRFEHYAQAKAFLDRWK